MKPRTTRNPRRPAGVFSSTPPRVTGPLYDFRWFDGRLYGLAGAATPDGFRGHVVLWLPVREWLKQFDAKRHVCFGCKRRRLRGDTLTATPLAKLLPWGYLDYVWAWTDGRPRWVCRLCQDLKPCRSRTFKGDLFNVRLTRSIARNVIRGRKLQEIDACLAALDAATQAAGL